jgi:hypothetical protein
MCDQTRTATISPTRSSGALLAVIALLMTGPRATAQGDRRICEPDAPFEKTELVVGLNLTGQGENPPVELLYQAKASTHPVLARFTIGDGPPVLAAPDRLVLGFDGPVRAGDVLGVLSSDTGPPNGPAPTAAIRELGGGAWLVTVQPGLRSPALLSDAEREAFARAPGLALVSALKRHLGPISGPGSGSVLRSASIDRLIPLEESPAPLRAAASTPPKCPARQGAAGLQGLAPSSCPATVAIVDSGIFNHPDLHRVLSQDAVDTSNPGQVIFGNSATKPCKAACSHGTSVAGAVASSRFGVAPNTPLVPIRVFDAQDCGWSSAIASGLYLAAKRARIVVLAWTFAAMDRPRCGDAGGAQVDEICQAIKTSPEALFVAAAGNAGKDLAIVPFYPPAWAGELENLLVVGGVNSEDGWFSSNRGSQLIHLAGIAGECKTTIPNGGFDGVQGTSMAAGFAAGAAALYWAKNPTATPAEVKNALSQSARLRGSGKFQRCCLDCGVLDVARALGGQATTVTASKPQCPFP